MPAMPTRSEFSAPINSLRTLDRRLRIIFKAASIAAVMLGLMTALFGATVMPLVCAVISIAAIYYLVLHEQDILIVFLVGHPGLTYLLTTQIYGLMDGNFEMEGFYNPKRAFLIVAIYQISLLIAYVAFRFTLLRSVVRDVATKPVDAKRAFIAAAGGGLTVFVIRYVSFGQSLGPVLIPVLLWCGGAAVTRARSRETWLPLVAGAVLIAAVSLLTNQRAYIFTAVLFVGIIGLGKARSILSARNIVLGLVLMFVLNTVSISFLAARPDDREKVSIAQVLGETLAVALEPKTWAQAVPFFGEADEETDSIVRRGRYYSAFLEWGNGERGASSIGARLAQVAHLDIISGQSELETRFDMPGWRSQFGYFAPGNKVAVDDYESAALFSDNVVWDMRLRQNNLVGRPLITPVGEIYLLSGIFMLPLVTAIMFYCVLFGMTLLRRVTGYSAEYVAMGMVLLHTLTFTGTALNIVGLLLRGLPLTCAGCWIARYWLGTRTRPRSQPAVARQPQL